MVDLARIGFSADTGDLDTAKAKLSALIPAAKSAEKATDGFNRAAAGITKGVGGAAAGIQSFSGAVNAAARGAGTMSRGALAAGTAMGTISSAAAGATASINRMNVVAQQFGPPTAAFNAYQAAIANMKASLATVPAAATGARSSLARLGRSANDNINQMQATPGNIAAQFQDIGVTAAGGMQPYLIALQQGTQLSAAMQGGLGNLIAGFAQLLSPISILTIALVGLLAAWIQSVDWYKAAAAGLRAVADVMVVAAPYAAALGATLLVAFAPQIITSIYGMVVAIGTGLVSAISSATVAMVAFSVANPFSALILAIGAAIAAVYLLSEAFGGTFSQILKDVKDTGNYIINAFVWAYKSIVATWRMLPAAIADVSVQAANRAIAAIEWLVNAGIQRIKPMLELANSLGAGISIGAASFGRLGNANEGAAAQVVEISKGIAAAEQGVDRIGQGFDWVKDRAKAAAAAIRGFAAGIGPEAKAEKTKKGATDKAAAGGKTDAEKQVEAFDKMRLSSEAYVRSKMAETAAIGLSTREATQLKHATDLVNQSIQQGIPQTDARRKAIMEWSKAMTDADMALANAQGWKRLQEGMSSATADMAEYRGQLGMTDEQVAAYKWEVTWLGDALRDLTEATPAQVASLREFAQGMAQGEVSIVRMRERLNQVRDAFNFARDGARGFVGDLRSSLASGMGALESFATAALNVLDKVIDKMLDVTMDAAFQGDTKGSMGFINAIAGLFTGSSKVPVQNALGGVYGPQGRITQYAKGGVVNGSTFFNSASGMGEMGEAGPEAIMPLKRGSDGSLGVAVTGGRQAPAAAPVVNINNSYVISGSSTADMQATVRQSAEQTRSQLRTEVPAILAEYQQNGALV